MDAQNKQKKIKKRHYEYMKSDLLGQGAYAKVFKAKDTETNIDVALKFISKESYYTGNNQMFFEQEILLMNQLKQLIQNSAQGQIKQNHWHKKGDEQYIIFQHDNFEDENNNLIIILEYLEDSSNLMNFIQKSNLYTTFSDLDILKISYKILKGLRFLHSHNICHRDIKPENIIYCEKSQAIKLIDFGTSREIQKDQVMRQSDIGTFYYMAPEQEKISFTRSVPNNGDQQAQNNQFQELGTKDIGYHAFKVDVFAFGITLYQLLTKKQFKDLLEIENNLTVEQNIDNLKFHQVIKNILKKCLAIEQQRASVTELFQLEPYKKWESEEIFYFDPTEKVFEEWEELSIRNRHKILNLVIYFEEIEELKNDQMPETNSKKQNNIDLEYGQMKIHITEENKGIYQRFFIFMNLIMLIITNQDYYENFKTFYDYNGLIFGNLVSSSIILELKFYMFIFIWISLESLLNIQKICTQFYDKKSLYYHLHEFCIFHEYQLLEFLNSPFYKEKKQELIELQMKVQQTFSSLEQEYVEIIKHTSFYSLLKNSQLNSISKKQEIELIQHIQNILDQVIKYYQQLVQQLGFEQLISDDNDEIIYQFLDISIVSFEYLWAFIQSIQTENLNFKQYKWLIQYFQKQQKKKLIIEKFKQLKDIEHKKN